MTATTNFLPIIKFLQRSSKMHYCDIDKKIETVLPKFLEMKGYFVCIIKIA